MSWLTDNLGPIGTVVDLYTGYKSANLSSDAAQAASQAQLEAAKVAAESARFKPYGVTTGFGTSFFDENKQLAGYELDPVLQAFRNQYYTNASDVLGNLQMDPTQATQQYYAQQQQLMNPQRQAEDLALRQRQLQSGRIGLGLAPQAVGAGNAGGYINPEQYQRDLARAQADQQMLYQAQQQAQADIDRSITRGTGLMQTGFGVEQQGVTPLTTGADIGKAGVQAGGQQATALLSGGLQAAQSNLASGLAQAGMFQNFGKTLTGR